VHFPLFHKMSFTYITNQRGLEFYKNQHGFPARQTKGLLKIVYFGKDRKRMGMVW
jgi:hypothetical protein